MEFLNFLWYFHSSFCGTHRDVKIITFGQFYSMLCNFNKFCKFSTKFSMGLQCFGVTSFFINGAYIFMNIGSKPTPD